jgi:uncharacterized protein YfkK (UPF0435 family)
MREPSLKQAYEKLKYLRADEEIQYLYRMECTKEGLTAKEIQALCTEKT